MNCFEGRYWPLWPSNLCLYDVYGGVSGLREWNPNRMGRNCGDISSSGPAGLVHWIGMGVHWRRRRAPGF